jgi:hypothetical protein
VEDAESGANGSLVIAEYIPCQSDPWIEILVGGVAHKRVRHVLESGSEGWSHRIEKAIVISIGLDSQS